MAIIEEFVLKIKAKTDDLIRGGNEVERQKKKFTDDQKKRDKEDEKRRKKELDHNKQVKKDLLDRIKHTKDLALKITGLAGIFSAVGMAKLTDDTIKQADALQFLGKEFGMAASRVKAFQDAARLGGGTAEGMTEALSSAASDVALHRLKGKSIYEMGGGQLLAQYGGMAGVNWDEAMKDTESYLTAKMQTIAWLQKQSKETLRGVDPKQAASQLAIEAGMSGIMNPMQDYAQFQKDLAARSRVAGLASGQEDTARKAQRELTQIQLQFEDLTKTIVMQAVAPEITKIGKAIGSLSERDKQKAVETIQKIIQGIETLATDFYKLSQDKDTKEFFKEVGGAVSTAANAIDDTVKSTVGWKTAIEGLIGLRLLAFFGGLAGAIGLGAGVGVTGAILAAAGAVALLAGNFDKVKESSKKAIDYVGEKLGVKNAYDKSVSAVSNVIEKGANVSRDAKEYIFSGNKELTNTDLITKLHKAGKKYGFNADEILKTYQESGLDPNILLAQAYQESKFNPNAISSVGARGFAQFMPGTARQYGMSVFDSMDAEKSAKAQSKMMKSLLHKYGGNYQLALSAYNGGGGAADYLKKHPEFLATPDRSKKAQSLWRGQSAGYQKDILTMAGSQDTQLLKQKPKQIEQPQLKERAPVIPVDYTGTEQKKALPKPMVVDKGQYNQNITPTVRPVEPIKPVINPLPTPLPAPLPPPGATTNNQSAVNNATINNTFNIKSTEPKAAANEIKSALDSYANFSNPVVNSFNTGFSE